MSKSEPGGRTPAARWMTACALGEALGIAAVAYGLRRWAPAMAVIMIAATSVQGSWPLHSIALAGAGAGAIAGLLVGAATTLALPRRALSDV